MPTKAAPRDAPAGWAGPTARHGKKSRRVTARSTLVSGLRAVANARCRFGDRRPGDHARSRRRADAPEEGLKTLSRGEAVGAPSLLPRACAGHASADGAATGCKPVPEPRLWVGCVGLRPVLSCAERRRRLEPGGPDVAGGRIALWPACRAQATGDRGGAQTAAHGGERQWHRAEEPCRAGLVPEGGRRMVRHRAWQTGAEWFVESLHDRLCRECFTEHVFPLLGAARRTIEARRTDCNHVWPGRCLGGLPPTVYVNRSRQGQPKAQPASSPA